MQGSSLAYSPPCGLKTETCRIAPNLTSLIAKASTDEKRTHKQEDELAVHVQYFLLNSVVLFSALIFTLLLIASTRNFEDSQSGVYRLAIY